MPYAHRPSIEKRFEEANTPGHTGSEIIAMLMLHVCLLRQAIETASKILLVAWQSPGVKR